MNVVLTFSQSKRRTPLKPLSSEKHDAEIILNAPLGDPLYLKRVTCRQQLEIFLAHTAMFADKCSHGLPFNIDGYNMVASELIVQSDQLIEAFRDAGSFEHNEHIRASIKLVEKISECMSAAHNNPSGKDLLFIAVHAMDLQGMMYPILNQLCLPAPP